MMPIADHAVCSAIGLQISNNLSVITIALG